MGRSERTPPVGAGRHWVPSLARQEPAGASREVRTWRPAGGVADGGDGRSGAGRSLYDEAKADREVTKHRSRHRGAGTASHGGSSVGGEPVKPEQADLSSWKAGQEVAGRVKMIGNKGLFLDVGAERDALLPWRQTTLTPESYIALGDIIDGLHVQRVDTASGRIVLRGPYSFGSKGDAWGEWAGVGEDWQQLREQQAAEDEGATSSWLPGRTSRSRSAYGAGWQQQAQADAWTQGGWAAGFWQEHAHPHDEWACDDGWQAPQRAFASAPDQWTDDWQAHGDDAGAWQVQEQGWEEAPVVAAAASSGGRAGGAKAAKEREAMIDEVFEAFDLDMDGRLNSAELREFAAYTGFEGNDDDWATEYRLLCGHSRPNCAATLGIDLAAFRHLVNDGGEEGCYCSDGELSAMLAEMRAPAKVAAAAAAALAGSSSSSGDRVRSNDRAARDEAAGPSEEPRGRAELKRAVFRALLPAGPAASGRLGNVELRFFAEGTGFDGDDADWTDEYQLLCTERGCDTAKGMDEAAWSAMVDDESERGCYCSDEELSKFLAAARERAGGGRSQHEAPAEAPPEAPAASGAVYPLATRDGLKAAVFKHFDADGDGRLRRIELLKFAARTGFDGGEGEWGEEYALLCEERGCTVTQGLDERAFGAMVDDESEAGCYCTDEELRAMLPAVAPTPSVPLCDTAGERREAPTAASAPAAASAAPASSAALGAAVCSKVIAAVKARNRQELKQRVFAALDVDRDGCLDRLELRAFAAHSGFDGDDKDWAEEYTALCDEVGADAQWGVDFSAFSTMVDDHSDSGCYMTEEELEQLLVSRSAALATPDRASTAPAPAPAAATPAAPPSAREELTRAVFSMLDADRDGLLNQRDLLPFVQQTGFEGTDEDWAEEYQLLCNDIGCEPARGLTAEQFSALVDDPSDSGCHCTDDELKAMLKKDGGARTQPAGPHRATAAAVPSREPPGLERGGAQGKDAQGKGAQRKGVQDKGAQVTGAKGKGAHGNGSQSKGSHKESEEDDPWAMQADPWAAQADPWATPAAKRASEKGKRAEEAKAAEAEKSWGKWQDSGRPGAEADFSSKPAMDAQKLLAASRAALAARKAAEGPAAEPHASQGGDRGSASSAEPPPPRSPSPDGSRQAGASSSRQPEVVRPQAFSKLPSMSVALAYVGAAVARASMGEQTAIQDLVDAVRGSPCVAHALAVATNSIRSLLLGRVAEARTLLALDEVVVHPIDGEVALLYSLGALARAVGAAGAPLLVRVLTAALAKVEERRSLVRSAAVSATEDIVNFLDRFGFEAALQALLAALDPKRGPTMKVQALRLLAICWRGAEGEAAVAQKLHVLLPACVALLSDAIVEVRTAAADATDVLLRLCGNRDLEPHLEQILSCAKGDEDVTKCVRNLCEVVFAQQVDSAALAVVIPILVKGLRSRNLRTQRQAAVIAENMCRLVPSAVDVMAFVPQLLPLLLRVSEDASDPDVRAVAGRAHAALSQVADTDLAGAVSRQLVAELRGALPVADVAAGCPGPVRDVILGYVATISAGLGRCRSGTHDLEAWEQRLRPHLEPLVASAPESGGADLSGLVARLVEISGALAPVEVTAPEEPSQLTGGAEEPAEAAPAESVATGATSSRQGGQLCNCYITLACGAATLLANARLRLSRGRVYGLVGANDSGKSTLLRAIHDRRLAGFPDASKLVSGLVEHGIGEHPPDCNFKPLEFLMADAEIRRLGVPRERIADELRKLGFEERGRSNLQIKALSGGWRMKLSLIRAILQEPDLLLLDEPTGHLDADHISWLQEYIAELQNDRERLVTVLVVSHDALFLERVCTDIIHIKNRKLHTYAGSFSGFLEKAPDADLGVATGAGSEAAAASAADKPGAASLDDSAVPPSCPVAAFSFPDPGSLPGIRSRGRRFLHLEGASYTYPGGGRPAVRAASVECSLRSRVAIVGPNGAGKSTLAALVVGELAPDSGTAWRHPNLRVAFVAQHAFHHLEQHMDLTATEYLLWRFNGNEDREAVDFRAAEAECDEPKTFHFVGGRLEPCPEDAPDVARPDVVVDRRQRGRLGYEYEVRFQGNDTSMWLSRAQLAEMGCLGMATREDERQAASRALSDRPLTTPAVEAHLAAVGLHAEEASHRRLGALSSGQRARAVLGAATWLAPHLLVLDEPTNYLDRSALAALAAGLQNFGGGVMVITHTMAFVDDVCSERWVMEDGMLRREGVLLSNDGDEAAPASSGDAVPAAPRSAAMAAMAATKEARDKKRNRRLKELRRKNGEEVSDDDDTWWEDLLQKTKPKAAKS